MKLTWRPCCGSPPPWSSGLTDRSKVARRRAEVARSPPPRAFAWVGTAEESGAALDRFQAVHEVADSTLEGGSEAAHRLQRGIPSPVLQRSHVGAMDPGLEGQTLLGDPEHGSALTHTVTERDLTRGRSVGRGHGSSSHDASASESPALVQHFGHGDRMCERPSGPRRRSLLRSLRPRSRPGSRRAGTGSRG